jgi:hypothetical protein
MFRKQRIMVGISHIRLEFHATNEVNANLRYSHGHPLIPFLLATDGELCNDRQVGVRMDFT